VISKFSFLLSCALGLCADSPVVIRDVRVFDGSTIRSNTSVLVRGNRIESINSGLAIPKGAEIIEGRGKTLLPGLIDSSTHASTHEALRQALRLGVTTQVDLGGDPMLAAKLRDEQANGRAFDRADLFSGGNLVTCPGCWGSQGINGRTIPTLAGQAHVNEFIVDRIREGSDFIMVILDDRNGRFRAFDRDTFAAIIEAARKSNKLTIASALFPKFVRWAIEAGAGGLSHFYWPYPPDPELPHLMHDRGLFMITGLTLINSEWDLAGDGDPVLDKRLTKFVSAEGIKDLNQRPDRIPSRAVAAERYSNGEKELYRVYVSGVPILAGSEAPGDGTTYGASLHRELELMVRAGIKPIDALRGATSIPAKHLGLGERGRIAVGARADLVLVEGDPSTDITNTRNILAVWKEGKKIVR